MGAVIVDAFVKKIAMTTKVDKEGVLSVATQITLEVDNMNQDDVKALARLQHFGGVCVTVEATQGELPLANGKTAHNTAETSST